MVKNKKRHTSQIGTKIYMAPEMKNSNYSLPVDIYSLGLVDVLIFKALALGLELPYWFKILNLHYKSPHLWQVYKRFLLVVLPG